MKIAANEENNTRDLLVRLVGFGLLVLVMILLAGQVSAIAGDFSAQSALAAITELNQEMLDILEGGTGATSFEATVDQVIRQCYTSCSFSR